jgi:hypothetical protein
MKSIIMPVHEQLDEKTKDQLFKEVKETVAKPTIEKIRVRNYLLCRKCGTGKDEQSLPVT